MRKPFPIEKFESKLFTYALLLPAASFDPFCRPS